MCGVHIASGFVDLHWIAVVCAVQKDRIAPKAGDLCFVVWPLFHMLCKDRAKRVVRTYFCIKCSGDAVDFSRRDVKSRKHLSDDDPNQNEREHEIDQRIDHPANETRVGSRIDPHSLTNFRAGLQDHVWDAHCVVLKSVFHMRIKYLF
jgi:hypothetical protein